MNQTNKKIVRQEAKNLQIALDTINAAKENLEAVCMDVSDTYDNLSDSALGTDRADKLADEQAGLEDVVSGLEDAAASLEDAIKGFNEIV